MMDDLTFLQAEEAAAFTGKERVASMTRRVPDWRAGISRVEDADNLPAQSSAPVWLFASDGGEWLGAGRWRWVPSFLARPKQARRLARGRSLPRGRAHLLLASRLLVPRAEHEQRTSLS